MTAGNGAVRRVLLVGLVLAAAVFSATVATAATTDDTILNQTVVQDATGDSGTGADLSTLTVTTYADGTASFAVQFANRAFLHLGETVQVFVDVNGDGTADLNLSIWPSFSPSYLARWTGSAWTDIRQLPELAETSGSMSVRLRLSELQSAAAAPVGTFINVSVGSWTADSSGNIGSGADDLLPSNNSWVKHPIEKPAATTTTTTTTTTSTQAGTTTSAASVARPAAPVASSLTLSCLGKRIAAKVKVAQGTKVVSVGFYAGGKLRSTDSKAPYTAFISARGLSSLTVSAIIHLQGSNQSLHKRAPACS